MSACEVFVDYGDEPDTDFDKICPEIKQEFNYKREYIVEYIEGQLRGQSALYWVNINRVLISINFLDGDQEMPTQPPQAEEDEDFDDSCDAILNQNARTCSKMFADSCMSCDTR